MRKFQIGDNVFLINHTKNEDETITTEYVECKIATVINGGFQYEIELADDEGKIS